MGPVCYLAGSYSVYVESLVVSVLVSMLRFLTSSLLSTISGGNRWTMPLNALVARTIIFLRA